MLTPDTSPLPIRAATASRTSDSLQKRRTPSASYNSPDSSAKQKTISPSRKLMNMAEVLKVKSSPLALAQSLKSRSQSRTVAHSSNSLEKPQPVSNEKLSKSAIASNTSTLNLTPLEAELMPDTTSSVALPLDVSLVQGVFSAIMSWGMDLSIDQLCMDKMGLMPPGRHVISGIRG